MRDGKNIHDRPPQIVIQNASVFVLNKQNDFDDSAPRLCENGLLLRESDDKQLLFIKFIAEEKAPDWFASAWILASLIHFRIRHILV